MKEKELDIDLKRPVLTAMYVIIGLWEIKAGI